MTFSIVHICVAFIVGYVFGALGMWLVQRLRSSTTRQDNEVPLPTVDPTEQTYLGLIDDDRTRIQTRPNLAIDKAPTLNQPLDSAELSIERVEALSAPLTSTGSQPFEEIEDSEDTEDLDLSEFGERPIETAELLADLTDDVDVEDILDNDDTLPFVRPKWKRPPN